MQFSNLLKEIEAAADGMAIAGEAVAGYREFYSLPDEHSCAHSMHVVATGDERVVVQLFQPASPVGLVYVCHGYYDHVGLYQHLIVELLAQGLAVVAFDQPGHGLSSGPRVVIDSFDQYVQALQDVMHYVQQRNLCTVQNPVHFVGQSMGGAVVMEYWQANIAEQPVTGSTVLLAPLVRPYAWWFNQWVFAVAKRTITQRPRTFTNNADNPQFLSFSKTDPLQARILPVRWVQAMTEWFARFEAYPQTDLAPFIIQGQADRTVSWRVNKKVLGRRYPNARWLVLPRARHHLVNESVALRMQMWQWLQQQGAWQGEASPRREVS